MKRVYFILTVLIICLITIAIKYSYQNFRIDENYAPLPLTFNPSNSESTLNWNGTSVDMYGGFIKGKMNENKKEILILRSQSPCPRIIFKNKTNTAGTYSIRIENVNPLDVMVSNYKYTIVDSHTIGIDFKLNTNESTQLSVSPKNNNKDNYEFVILGDNRNGYRTFSFIIDQINAIKPVFTIDNGDLVFGGDENRYRLFYETVSKLQTPLYTTLGNHDIRLNGRNIYTKLFGPPYYSFDYRNVHFVFLDSSRGWTEKRAITEEQYIWLNNDLKNNYGKQIFVISHIPPTDPRTYKNVNDLPQMPGVEKTSAFERMMDNYSQYKSMNHGFPDRNEAKRFENLMTKYKVNTVFLSHIHSYYSFMSNGVRYIISGGAGAELLTTNSYYHFLRVKITGKENLIEMVELPSPTNSIQDRYIAAVALFARSIFKEYRSLVLIIGAILAIAVLSVFWITRRGWVNWVRMFGVWISQVVVFAFRRFRELNRQRK